MIDWSAGEHETLLANTPLFSSLDAAALGALARQLEERHLAEGEVLFRQGEAGDAMFIVEEGAVDVVIGGGTSRVVLTSCFPGQYFGELSILDGAPRSADAVATKPTRLLELGRAPFVEFVRRDPEAALLILHDMADRIRRTNDLMTRTVSRNVLADVEERLPLGDRVADQVAAFGGSWRFIFLSSGLLALWMVFNTIAAAIAFDPLPFMFLNLMLSTVAALQAPIIMMSQNRQAAKDKALATNDFQVNLKNELGIDRLLKGNAELLQHVSMLERIIQSGGAPRPTAALRSPKPELAAPDDPSAEPPEPSGQAHEPEPALLVSQSVGAVSASPGPRRNRRKKR